MQVHTSKPSLGSLCRAIHNASILGPKHMCAHCILVLALKGWLAVSWQHEQSHRKSPGWRVSGSLAPPTSWAQEYVVPSPISQSGREIFGSISAFPLPLLHLQL